MRARFDGNMFYLDRYEDEQDAWLRSRPMCDKCDERIQEEYGYAWGELTVCKDCLDRLLEQLSDEELADIADMGLIDDEERKYIYIDKIEEDLRIRIDD